MNRNHTLVVLQTCVPDYRLPFFNLVAEASEGSLSVAAGGEFFSESVKDAARGQPWHRALENKFWWSRKLLWQKGAWQAASTADVAVLEWNPRVVSTWALLIYRRFSRKKTLVWGHVNSQEKRHILAQMLRDFMADLSDGVIAYTDTEARACQGRHHGLPVWSAPNSCVSRDAVRPALREGVRPRNVIYVGRLTAAKKPEILLKAWHIVTRQLPHDARLVLVGNGPECDALLDKVKAWGLEDRVVMPGHISDPQQLRSYYEEALVAVSPGYVGLSAIQCMAFGVPMAISKTEPHSPEIEACREHFNCEFFTTDSPEDLANLLLEFYRRDVEWTGRRAEISAEIRRSYTYEKMAGSFAKTLDGLSVTTNRLRVALVWEQYGPYHYARLRALQKKWSAAQVIGLEMSNTTRTYQWRVEGQALINALETAQPVEAMGAFRTYLRAVRFFRRAAIKIVLVPSYWPPTSLAILLAAKRVGAHTVMMNDSHAATSRASGWQFKVKRYLAGSFDTAFVAGTPQRRYFEALGLPKDYIFEGYDAVDNEFYSRRSDECRQQAAELRSRFGLPDHYFLNIGRMEQKKNLQVLLSAFALARRSPIGCFQLVLVGSGSEEAALKQQCLSEGLTYADMSQAGAGKSVQAATADVLFYGFRQSAELPIFYSLAKAFILPSLWEEWGLVVNEAMASGIPVIVSKTVGSASDLVREGETGFVFDPTSPEQLAEYLQTVTAQPALSTEMGHAARETILRWGLDNFSINAIAAAQAAVARNEQ